jgi:hypothetical protein
MFVFSKKVMIQQISFLARLNEKETIIRFTNFVNIIILAIYGDLSGHLILHHLRNHPLIPAPQTKVKDTLLQFKSIEFIGVVASGAVPDSFLKNASCDVSERVRN